MEPLALSLLPVLGYAAWSDHRTRECPSWLWYPHIAAGLWLAPTASVLAAAGLTAGLLGLHRLGRAGMADVKAVAAASLVLPFSSPYGPPAPVLVLAGALGLSLLWPASVAFRNALRDGLGAGVSWTVRTDREGALASKGWLADGTDLMDASESDLDADGVFEVRPSVPFLVPLAAAYAAALLLF